MVTPRRTLMLGTPNGVRRPRRRQQGRLQRHVADFSCSATRITRCNPRTPTSCSRQRPNNCQLDVLGHLVILVIITRPTVQQLQGCRTFRCFSRRVQAAVVATSNTRQQAFPDVATAQARITELNNRLHSAILTLQLDAAKLVALNVPLNSEVGSKRSFSHI